MANTFQTTAYVTDEFLIRFINYLSFARMADRRFENFFGDAKYATGQTINYRKEERYIGGEGATAIEEDRIQVVNPLTIDKQFHVMTGFGPMELTFDRALDEPYLNEMLNPQAKILANKVENFVGNENFAKQTYHAIGSGGTALTFQTILDARSMLNQLGVPQDGQRYLGINAVSSAAISNSLSNFFNSKVNEGAMMDGFMGHLSGFDVFESEYLFRQIAGTGEAGGAPPAGYRLGGTITGGPVSSGSSLSVTGVVAASQVFNEGDIIEVAAADAVYEVNPLSYENVRNSAGYQNKQFVVTADVTSTGGGAATIPISPAIVTSGPLQNVSQAIPNGAQMLLKLDHDYNIAYQKQAVVFAAPRLAELKGGVEVAQSYSEDYKMSITHSMGGDIRNYRQLDRMDTICGVSINPEFAVRICT